MGGRAIGAGGRGPHMAAASRGRRTPGLPFRASRLGRGLQGQGKGARGGQCLLDFWLPGYKGKIPAGLEAAGLGERQGRDVRLSRCEVEVLGTPKNRPDLRDGKPEPVNVLERIMEQTVIVKIE